MLTRIHGKSHALESVATICSQPGGGGKKPAPASIAANWFRLLCVFVLVLAWSTRCFAQRRPPFLRNPSELEKVPVQSFADRFDLVVQVAKAAFYDQQLLSRTFTPDTLAAYRAKAVAANDVENFADVINQLLAELKTSHCSYWPNTSVQYYELKSIFSLENRDSVRVPTIGVVARKIDDQWFVAAVLKRRQPIAGDGEIRLGDRLVSVNGGPFSPVLSLAEHVGKRVRVTVERKPGETVEVDRLVRLEHPVAPYVEDMLARSKVMSKGGVRIGYSRLWWMGRKETLMAAFASLAMVNRAEAVVVDLRDGWGGQPYEYSNLFNRDAPFCICVKPVVALINDGTRSAKEVVAFDLRNKKRGVLVGRRTHGAVIPSAGYPIGPDGLLVLAVSKMRPERYARLEGAGVKPDVPVPFDLRYANGRDPQLDRAVDEIVKRMPKVAGNE